MWRRSWRLSQRGNLSAGIREDRGNRWVLGAFAVIGLLLAWLPAYTDRIGFWTLDGEPLRWVGAAIYIGGVIVRMWPVFILGRRFSGLVAIQSDHALVTTGLYSVIRHPSYMGLLISSLGWALAFRSIVGVLLAALTAVPLIARIRAEEALLASQFGAAYAAYRAALRACCRTSGRAEQRPPLRRARYAACISSSASS